MEGPSADSVEKHEPASDVDTVVVDSLKALDPNRPIREATAIAICRAVAKGQSRHFALRKYSGLFRGQTTVKWVRPSD
jgi:hypothetical protein